MDKNAPITTGSDDPPSDAAQPVGEHALEVAARRGLGAAEHQRGRSLAWLGEALRFLRPTRRA